MSPPRLPAPRLGPGRLALVVGGAAALALVAIAVAPLVGVVQDPGGARRLVWLDLGRALAGGPGNADAEILFLARLPRVLAAALAGAGLAAAGAAFQALLRNPLAEPYTVGVASGASLGAVVAIRLGVTTLVGASGATVGAFLGALGAILVVWRLARVGSALPPATLLIAGVTLAVICSSAIMLLQSTASFTEAYRIVRWMLGGLDWIRYPDVVRCAIVVGAGLGVLVVLARDLNALAAGAESAASVGVDADRVTLIGYVAACLVVGAIIAVAGPIGFVGLVVPHAVRAIVGPDHRALLPASIFAGAAFVVACDTIARLVLAPAQLPVGVVTALLGGPFFLWLLVHEKSRARLWGRS